MLQLPQSSIRARGPLPPTRKQTSGQAKRVSQPSVLEAAIAAHKAALRISRNRQTEFELLQTGNPELSEFFPAIHFFTDGKGEKRYARLLREVEKLFPEELDHIAPIGREIRERFVQKASEAREERKRERKTAGYDKASDRCHRALLQERAAFRNLMKVKPQNSEEAKRLARYVLRAVKTRVGGTFRLRVTHTQLDKMGLSWEDYKDRMIAALSDLHAVIRAMAK